MTPTRRLIITLTLVVSILGFAGTTNAQGSNYLTNASCTVTSQSAGLGPSIAVNVDDNQDGYVDWSYCQPTQPPSWQKPDTTYTFTDPYGQSWQNLPYDSYTDQLPSYLPLYQENFYWGAGGYYDAYNDALVPQSYYDYYWR